jgi:hypothetical protein
MIEQNLAPEENLCLSRSHAACIRSWGAANDLPLHDAQIEALIRVGVRTVAF